ncbi:MAG: hypothetical protein M0022_08705, partial [Desulfobacteraceae bacterium]|nr:hypothetical protein [Desulfobacteraceae bacterium]
IASNREFFIDEVRRRTGFNIEVLSGEAEAAASAFGVYCSLKYMPALALIVDAGGGSTELTLTNGKDIISSISLNMGAVSLTEMFLGHGPGYGRAFELLEQYVKNALKKMAPNMLYAPKSIIGVGGSATTMGAMLLGMARYDPARIRGFCPHMKELKALLSRLKDTPLDARRAIVGLDPERADIISAGIAIFLSVLSFFKLEYMTVTDGGLLFGLLMNLMQKEFGVHAESSYTSGIYI